MNTHSRSNIVQPQSCRNRSEICSLCQHSPPRSTSTGCHGNILPAAWNISSIQSAHEAPEANGLAAILIIVVHTALQIVSAFVWWRLFWHDFCHLQRYVSFTSRRRRWGLPAARPAHDHAQNVQNLIYSFLLLRHPPQPAPMYHEHVLLFLSGSTQQLVSDKTFLVTAWLLYYRYPDW